MAKLNLVIADLDESYAKALSQYINSNHSTTFLVSCFTKADSLIGYMEQKSSVDVLLISPDFYDLSVGYFQIKLKAVLSEGVLCREYSGFQVINKYSTGEKLISEVIHLYSKINPFELRFSQQSKNAELIGVYSPAGGTGKTTIATALSMQCMELGKRSFYLNLESIQSTGVFFNSESKRNLSYVFYYLKEKSKNLSFKMDGIKSTEDVGVHYFNPPESPVEYEEINTDELEQLIKGIKGMGCYDFIFIDMSNIFDMKNYKIMGLCDRIVLVTLQEPISLYKNRVLFNELVKLSDKDKEGIVDKFITVINKYKEKNSESIENSTIQSPVTVRIPEYTRALISEEGKLVIDDDNFRKAINQLIKEISAK